MLRQIFVSIGSQWKCTPCCHNGRDKSVTGHCSVLEAQSPRKRTKRRASSIDDDGVQVDMPAAFGPSANELMLLEGYNDRIPMEHVRGDIAGSDDDVHSQEDEHSQKFFHDTTLALKKSLEKAESLIEAEAEEEGDEENSDAEEDRLRPPASPHCHELMKRVRMSVHDCGEKIHNDQPLAMTASQSQLLEHNPYLHEDVEPAGIQEWGGSQTKKFRNDGNDSGDDSGEDGVHARYKKHKIAQRLQELRYMMTEEGLAPPKIVPNGHGKRALLSEQQKLESAYLAEIQSYQDDMRWKFEAIGIESGRKEHFVSTATPSAAVRDAVAKYHNHCVLMGRFYAMPGEMKDHYGLQTEEHEKLEHFQRDLRGQNVPEGNKPQKDTRERRRS